jgi:hypothetical protein
MPVAQVDNWLRLTFGCATLGGVGEATGDLASRGPERAARDLVAALEDEGWDVVAWVGRFVAELDTLSERDQLQRIMDAWGLSKAETARVFGVSRQALSKWLTTGVPPERFPVVADLAAATDLLVRYLKRDRIPAVVRRPAQRLDGSSLLDLARQGRADDVLTAVRELFDLHRAVS